MCVIIIKPANVAMPDFNTLYDATMANPHGFGFATPNKIFKTLDRHVFLSALADVPDSEPCIIHCRLATHGSIKKANCHPFKHGDIVFAHNGILDIAPRGDLTDSETAFLDIIYPAIDRFGFGSQKANTVIRGIIGFSRFAIMKGREILKYGSYTELNGCYYSNLRFYRLGGWQTADRLIV